MSCNIGRKEELQRVVDAANQVWGRIDIVMANAAIHPWVGSVLDLKEETFNKFMQVNVQSSIWLAQMTVPGMLERGYGRFIVVASVVGILGDPVTGTYGLTKAADMQFVRNIAMEFASRGITANCIAPGTFKTEMARSQVGGRETRQVVPGTQSITPLRRSRGDRGSCRAARVAVRRLYQRADYRRRRRPHDLVPLSYARRRRSCSGFHTRPPR